MDPSPVFKDERHNLPNAPEPSADYVALTADLFHTALTMYDSEKERGNEIYGYLGRLLGTSLDRPVWAHERTNRKTTEADAVVGKPIENPYFDNKSAVVAYVELKNGLGIRGDGGLQVALSLRRYLAQEHVELNGITLDLPRRSLEVIYSMMVYRMRRVVHVSYFLLLVDVVVIS